MNGGRDPTSDDTLVRMRNKNKLMTLIVIITLGFVIFVSQTFLLAVNSIYKGQHPQQFVFNDSSEKNREVFQDEMFAPLLDLFRKKAKGELTPNLKNFRSGNIPKVYIWSEPLDQSLWDGQLVHIRSNLCPLTCEVTFDINERNSSDAIVIFLTGTSNADEVTESLSPRDPLQPWIMMSYEAPPRANNVHQSNYTGFQGFFNRTMMYRRDADIRVPHGFIVKRGDDADSLPPSWIVPPKMDKKDTNSSSLAVAFISNCNAQTRRLKYISEVRKYAQVDIVGSCGNLECGHSMYASHKYNVTSDPCLMTAGEEYLFFLAFENSFCTDYITEKAYNLLYYNMVPVFLGSADYSTFFPPNSYIDATLYSPKELAEKLLYLQANPKEYEKYLEWRNIYQPSTVGGERILCHMCARLYDPDFYEYQIIDDFYDWFVSKSRCVQMMDL